MAPVAAHHRPLRFASAFGPLSLLLLPKCPLCLLPLLAFLGVAMPASTALWIAAGVIVAVWLGLLLLASHRFIAAYLAAGAAVAAIAMQNRPLLWIAILAMTVSGFAATRACASFRR